MNETIRVSSREGTVSDAKPYPASSGKLRLLNIQEAAEYLGLKVQTIYNRIGPKAQNPFPVKAKRIGKKVLFDIRDLEAFVNSL
jgi:predicted DNA-binding transcriptional regulator AlpA